jgi:WD40 repeat protein
LREKDPYFIIWDLTTRERLATISYHVKAVSHVAFDERGMYLITVGGHDKITLAAWRVKDLIEAGKRDPCSILKGLQPICEFMVGKINVNCLKFDNQNSDYSTLNVALGVEKGVKFFTIKTNDRVIEEKMATIHAETLNNVFDIHFSKDDALAAGDNGKYYTFRADKVADANI